MKILLDSDAYSELRRGHPRVAEIVRASERVFFSAVVAAELMYGFRHGSRLEKNLRELRQFLDHPYIIFVPVTLTTSDRYSRIAVSLRRKGRPIPTNDIWIAAHAMETGAELISFDEHFQQVDGLVWTHLSA